MQASSADVNTSYAVNHTVSSVKVGLKYSNKLGTRAGNIFFPIFFFKYCQDKVPVNIILESPIFVFYHFIK